MDTDNKKNDALNDLPDVSGVFNIDDSEIPTDVIAPAADISAAKDKPGILISREEEIQSAKLEKKKLNETKKAEKKAQKHKLRKKHIILFSSGAAAMLIIALSIAGAVSNSKKPVVEVSEAVTESISQVYEAEGAVVTVADLGSLDTYVAVIENNYAVYGIAKDMEAKITLADGTVIEGRVNNIKEESTGDTLLSRIASLLIDGELADTSSYTVFVKPANSGALTDGTIVEVSIILKTADNTITVPTNAVKRDDNGQTYVWVYKKLSKKLVKQVVSTGIENSEKTEITEGIRTKTFVVTKSDEKAELYDGIKVKTN